MNRWQSQFDNHPIHSTLNQLGEWVNTNSEGETSETLIERRRFIKVLDAYQSHLNQIDPELLQFNQLDNLNAILSQPNHNIWNQIQSFSANGNNEHLKIANDHLTNQLGQLSTLIAISRKSRVEKPLKSLEKAVDKYNKLIIDKSSKFSSEINELKISLDERKQQTNELKDLINNQKEETNNQLNNWLEQFSASQEKRREEFNTLREKLSEEGRTQTKNLIDTESKRLTDHFNSYNEKITTHITDSNEKHAEILKLYNLVASDSVAASYVENANKENSQANIWRFISIGFIVLTVLWLGFSYWHNLDTNINGHIHWPILFGTISLTGVLLWGSAYSALQSTIHRVNEKNTRRFALEIKAIDPFLASLNEADRSELKKKLSEKLFGNSNDTDLHDGKVVDEHVLGTILKGISEVIEKVRK